MKQIELTSKLVVAIIGLTAVGAILVPTYAVPTIRSADIFDGEVKTPDLANGAVTNPKIANDAVTSGKIKNGEVKAEDIADGVIPDGGGTIQLNVHVVSETSTVQRGFLVDIEVDCPAGEILTGGGFDFDTIIPDVQILNNAPKDADTWNVVASSTSEIVRDVTAFALCIDPSLP